MLMSDHNLSETTLPVRVVALYRFTPFEDCEAIRGPLAKLCCSLGIRGILLLAHEGINGTIAGSDDAMDKVLEHIRSLPGCADLEIKESRAAELPFLRMKVRIKKEIVTMGVPGVDPRAIVGTYVDPADWNGLISDPDTIVIDTRNDYEVAVGTFRGAIDPQITTFREFPDWFRARRDELVAQGRTPKVAMFCTGGIRCEKSTAFAKAEGVEDVFHLKGGILKYLETIPENESLWEGECFVFDQRVTVKHGLEQGQYSVCHACRRPVSDGDKASPLYEEGVSCPACHDERTEAQRRRYADREQQTRLAAQRGTHHLGPAE
ncbi:oxygen-dependent tRNA uridine(34) hydroxylase TrhO [Acetobacter sicerae]|uniref:oxygen-dependent tRNA uridine(34) hydroxylase TrhO n=1 Tax=Acetobacter sicerae TaxID=85325 RepID=UPI00156B4098|nr:rhodanese-related sulfurtransferase [Acetobacter sicerae]NHN91526.1 rhodanese-related sulfurtransferase [Acetobacter sicerae]